MGIIFLPFSYGRGEIFLPNLSHLKAIPFKIGEGE